PVAPALLAGGDRDFLPVDVARRDALALGPRHGRRREHRPDRGHAQLDRLAHRKVHALAGGYALHEHHRQRRLALDGVMLQHVDGKRQNLAAVRGPNGLVVMFICNHCPYVKAVIERIVRDCRDLGAHGVGSVAVMSNDPSEYPEDSFENMKRIAREKGFPFPYLLDETQDVARAYGAACTPDFFGFNAGLELQYRGRLDASRRDPVPNALRELF